MALPLGTGAVLLLVLVSELVRPSLRGALARLHAIAARVRQPSAAERYDPGRERRAELDAGMWAAVPTETHGGRREAELVKRFEDVPRDAERVIFFPRAAGGAAHAA